MKLIPKSNYSEAVDSQTLFPDWLIKGVDWINAKTGWSIPTGASNCTLSATQYVNPSTPISRADTILTNGEYYDYHEIPEDELIPGDLIIATNPDNKSHHTMIFTGRNKNPYSHEFLGKTYNIPANHPQVTYSTGTTDVSGIRSNIGLLEYLDNSHGKTDLRYFRYQKPIMLPELVVTPWKN